MVNELSSSPGTKKFWDKVNSFKKSAILNPCSPAEISRENRINEFIDSFAPFGASKNLDVDISITHGEPLSVIFKEPFSVQEVISHINKSKTKSSPGRDLISHSILKNTPYKSLVMLTKCFNKILEDGSFPNQWRDFTVTLINKPNNKGYRPISLASCILKLMEKLVKTRLEKFVELDCVLPKCQYGFRRGRSCDSCLALLNMEIYRSFSEGKISGGLFLDVRAA
jgi:hypothetical protein